MFSDGFIDQYGGEGRRFYKSAFIDMLHNINELQFNQQSIRIRQINDEWRKNTATNTIFPQTDDILIIGFRPESYLS